MSKKNISIAIFIIIFGVGLFLAISSFTNQQAGISTTSGSSYSSTKADGTYSFTQSYAVPEGGKETIQSTITIKNGLISEVKNTMEATKRESREYQSGFESAIQSAAVGKKIDSLNLSSVGGASLTTAAFLKGIKNM